MIAFVPTTDPGSPGNQMAGASGLAATINAGFQTALNQNRGFVNAFRNPGFAVAQRGASGSVASGLNKYTLDGWMVAATGATLNWSQDTATKSPYTGLKLSCATGLTAATLQQRISSEAMQALQPPGQAAISPITVQFLVTNNTSAPITPQIAAGYASAKNNFATVTSDLAATNLQPVAAGASVVVAYTWTPNANCVNGYQIQLLLGGGLNLSTGSLSVFAADCRDTLGGTTGLNSSPAVPELRDFADELRRNTAYYWDPANGGSTAAFVVAIPYVNASGTYDVNSILLPPMIATGAISLTNRNISYGGYATSVGFSTSTPGAIAVTLTMSGAGEGHAFFNLGVSAEL